MKYQKIFVLIVVTSASLGIFLALMNNSLLQLPSEKINNTLNNFNKNYVNETDFDSTRKRQDFLEEKEEQENEIKTVKTTEAKIQEGKEKQVENKLRISAAYSLNNQYVYPTLVAMTSLAENAGPNTYYDIYVMISPDFTEENKKILKSVEDLHYDHCSVIFLDMGNKFKDEKTDKRIPREAYYRLELHNLLPDVHRIIWMDGDTAVFGDLTELITFDMKGNYIMGFLDSLPNAIENFGVMNATVLCSGVLLMDLDALRNNNMTEKFNKFMNEFRDKINQHDQTVINVVCQGKIAPLPPKYGIWCFEAEKYGLAHNARQRPWLRYDVEEFKDAYYHPVIIHFVWPKPFWRAKKPVFNKEWWEYARKTGYYDDIYNKSPKKSWRILHDNYYNYIY